MEWVKRRQIALLGIGRLETGSSSPVDDFTSHSEPPPLGQMPIDLFLVGKQWLISPIATLYPAHHRKLSCSSLVVRVGGVPE